MSKRFNNFKSGGRCKLSGDCWLLQRLTERQELNLGLNYQCYMARMRVNVKY